MFALTNPDTATVFDAIQRRLESGAGFLGNSLWAWFAAALLAAGTYVALRLVLRLTGGRLKDFASRTTTDLDDVALNLLQATSRWFLLILALRVGSLALHLSAGVDRLLHGATILALFAQAAIWGNQVIDHWLARRRSTQADAAPTLAGLGAVRFLARLILWSMVVLLAMANLGIDVSALVAGLGVGGVAVALATQNILGDVFCSVAILLDRPFEVGDFIIAGAEMGVVENIGVKTTRLRSLRGEQIVMSNADLMGSRIQNFKRMNERRIVLEFGVVYQTPADTLEAIPPLVKEAVEAQSMARFDRAHFKGFGASSLDFEVVYYVLSREYNDYMDTQQTINLELVRRFQAQGVEFAYPTQTLFLDQEQGKKLAVEKA